uniref:Uncharacterized protein n=1 Tax=Arundo donax TaxID=35708 RepID=A0A0A8ZVI8_ARUDO
MIHVNCDSQMARINAENIGLMSNAISDNGLKVAAFSSDPNRLSYSPRKKLVNSATAKYEQKSFFYARQIAYPA